jgi:cytochrome c-type biogenesis protein CcmH/NrfG
LSLASKALLALSLTEWRDAQAGVRLDRAERNANAALALAPRAVEPRLNLAVVLGMKSRRVALAEAIKQNYASRGRALIEQALKIAPNDPAAQALLGSWNLEVVRRGGVMGSRLLGASSRVGMRAFDRAASLAPDDPAIALQYAVALLGVDAKRYGDKAGSLLIAASAMAPRDAFEAAMRDEARHLAAIMAAGGAQAAAKQAAKAFL